MADVKKQIFLALSLIAVLSFPLSGVFSQNIDKSIDKVVPDVKIDLPLIGSVKPRPSDEIESSNWMIGCETLDRDFANYDEYKEYLVPLGIKLLRMQAGWAKTEKMKGEYNWQWLDNIINDATNRGLNPWLQTSYGNSLYPGGGGSNLGAGMPTSPEALKAYDKWVEAMVTRYNDKVKNWEVWNEPNFGDNTMNTVEMTADLNIRTAEIIKRIQPEARISGLALGHFGLDFAKKFFEILAETEKMNLFDNMTYHDYAYNPDANYCMVEEMKALLAEYGPNVKLRQGENGAPSAGGVGRGALWDYNWTEVSQAKWNTRRMLGNLGHDIECSIFSIIEMAYTNGPINRMNYKGIIQSDSAKRAIRPKIAYYAIQNVTSVFDNSLERIKDLTHSFNLENLGSSEHRYSKVTDRSLAVYGFQNRITKKQVYAIWMDENIPQNSNSLKMETFSFTSGNFEDPVFVDVLTGAVYEIPDRQWSKKGNFFTFSNIPVYDSPVLIADRSLIIIPVGLHFEKSNGIKNL
jgi:hypothetical protein